MARVPRSETTRNELKQMFSGRSVGDRSALVRQAARLIVEEALEAEATQELGRDYYAHGAGGRGYRNGYRTGKVKSAEGLIEFAVPQVSDTAEPFRSQIRQVIRGRTEELERLAVEMYARGLSVRDIRGSSPRLGFPAIRSRRHQDRRDPLHRQPHASWYATSYTSLDSG